MSDQQGKNFEISNGKKEIYVLDSSALIGGYNPNLTNAQQFITPSIFEEVTDKHSRMILNLAVSNETVKVRPPTTASIKSVKNDAKNTGDLSTLSTIDIEVLALALDLKKENRNPIILSDDYALQNVAEILGISFKTIIREGIKQRFIWTRYCPSCKKQYPDTYSDEICEICGGKLKKRVLRKGN